jgi:hypothetical protein
VLLASMSGTLLANAPGAAAADCATDTVKVSLTTAYDQTLKRPS